MKTTEYHPTKIVPIVPIVQIIANVVKGIVEKNPGRDLDMDYVKACVSASIPGFWKKEECINCGAGMQEYIRELDIFVALLLLDMAKIVKDRVRDGVPFTEANKIRVSAVSLMPHSHKCQTTNASKLGLVAKVLVDGKHKGAEWAVTRRGWEALRGDRVPREVRVFRNKILERTDQTVTLGEVFEAYRTKAKEREAKRKPLKEDQRDHFRDYDRSDWVHIAGMNQGALFGGE